MGFKATAVIDIPILLFLIVYVPRRRHEAVASRAGFGVGGGQLLDRRGAYLFLWAGTAKRRGAAWLGLRR